MVVTDNYFAIGQSCPARGWVVSMYLPFPPSTNTYYRNITMGKRQAVLISKRGREYKKTIKTIIDNTELPLFWFSPNTKFTVRRIFYAPDNRARDIDNYSKVLWDSLKMGRVKKKKKDDTIIQYDDYAIFDDDTQIKREFTEWIDKPEWDNEKLAFLGPGVYIQLWCRGNRYNDIKYF